MRSRHLPVRAALSLVLLPTLLTLDSTPSFGHAAAAAPTDRFTADAATADASFLQQPQPQTVADGGSVTFAVEYPGALLYTWYRTDARGTQALAGSNSATYTFTASYADDDATYSVRLFDSNFVQHRSDEARLTVTPVAARVTEPPHDVSVQAYQNASFAVAVGGTAPFTHRWQRQDTDGGEWTDIAGATGAELSFKSRPADDGARFRVRVDNGHGPAAVSAPATLTVITGGGSLETVDRASFEWGVNPIYQGGNPANDGCNFFSAGTRDEFAGTDGNVRIIHRMPDGSAQAVSNATKCIPAVGSQLNQRVLFTNGTGTANPVTGEATIRWTGAFTANAYSGLVTWNLTDPTLTIAADGTGTLTAIGAGFGAGRDTPDQKTPVPARPVTVATFGQVRLDTTAGPGGGGQISPDFAGVDYFPLVDGVRSSTSAIPEQVKARPGWGSWPESFVDLQYETELAGYWHSSGLSADAEKPAMDLTVRFDSAPDVKIVPVILANPATTPTAPYVEGRDLTIRADVDGSPDLRWERSSSGAGPWATIAGESGETLTIRALDASWHNTYVRLVATSADGQAVSTALRITTAAYDAPHFTSQPADVHAIQGNRAVATFGLTAWPAVDTASIKLERSGDGGQTWAVWDGAEYTHSYIGGAQHGLLLSSIPIGADGALARVTAANVEGARTVSEPFTFRVHRATGGPQLVVLPGTRVDPAKETRLTVLGAGFDVPDWAGPTLTYSLDLGLFDSTVWTPGRAGSRDWVATSPDVSGGQIYRAYTQATGGTFTASLRVPAGVLKDDRTYGVGAFLRLTDISTWQDTFDNRSMDAWTPLTLPAPPSADGQSIVATVPEREGEFLWSIDGGDRAVTLTDAVDRGGYLQSTGELKPVTVTDTRIGGPAWSLSGQVGDFTGGLSGRYLGWSPSVHTAGGGAQAGPVVPSGLDSGAGLTAGANLGSAADGHVKGSAVLGAGLELRLPVTTEPGEYTVTLTLTALG